MTVSAAMGQAFRFPYVVEVKSDSDMEITDSAFYSMARSVIFPVNKYVIPENSEFYKELVHEIIPEMNALDFRLESVIIRGAASPEGPYNWNVFLGEHRRKALMDIIESNLTQPINPDALKTTDIPEDYTYLLRMMSDANDKDYGRVESYVDRYLQADLKELKRQLMRLDGGTLWKRLLKQYFPELRAARVVLFFRYTPRPIEMRQQRIDVAMGDMNIPKPRIKIRPKFVGLIPEPEVKPRREFLSVKTNLLFDFAYMPFGYKAFCPIPNVAVEYYPLHGHFTYGAMFDFPWWQGGTTNHKYFQVRNYTLESRYYFRSGDVRKVGIGNGAAFKGWYVSAYANAAIYGIGWSDNKGFDAPGAMGGHGWQGEGFGAGLGLGYVLPLSKNEHWRLEFSAQFGFFHTKYDPYLYGCPVEQKNDGLYYYVWYRDADEFRERQYRFNWLGPTRVSIQLSYDLLYRRNNKKGVSFYPYEKGGATW